VDQIKVLIEDYEEKDEYKEIIDELKDICFN
jgi:hypothetical protein